MNFKLWLESEVVPCGDCYRFANNLAREMLNDGIIPEKGIFVCHGTVVAPHSADQKRYEHAWVEAQDKVYDWQMRTSGKFFLPIKDFYELFRPENAKKYSPTQAMVNQVKHKHHGPWE
jgi:hypothetical protein